MSDSRPVDEPAPTVVGPQPAERRGGRKLNVPRGLEKLVALAGLGPEWRAKVLADPLAAARDAELELSASERAIITSVPPEALAGVVVSFKESVPRPSGLGRLAAGAAAAAVLTAALAGCGEDEGRREPSLGIPADRPPPNPRKVEPAPPAEGGVRPDVPEQKKTEAKRDIFPGPGVEVPLGGTTGIRADVPPARPGKEKR